MQLTISCPKFLLLQEEWIVEQSQGVENIKVGLGQNQYTPLFQMKISRKLTFLASTNASFISMFNLSFKPFSSLANAVSVA